jgi:hypothetical protein
MAVLIEAVSVVICLETIADKYPGGVEQYIEDCPNWSLCMDDKIARVGFMSPHDALDFIRSLERLGFRYVSDGEFDEIAVVYQFGGIPLPCDWLECLNVVIFKGDVRVFVCKMTGDEIKSFAHPKGWTYENSLSKQCLAISLENFEHRMVFLRHENGRDFYLDTLTDREMSIARTIRRNANA